MRELVEQHIRRYGLFKEGQLVICAVSGGVDSMVMASLLHHIGQPIKVAHVDHGLRGEQSDADHALVKSYASTLNVEFLSTKVNLSEGRLKGESTQMIARRMRYKWFNEILRQHPGALLATAHHSDDALETLLLGMVNGVGLKGLTGIPPKRGRIVRPLLGVRKQDIRDHAHRIGISYREDKSNQDPKYLRNRIRHELVPLLAELAGNSLRPLERFVELQRTLSQELSNRFYFACAESNDVYWWPKERLIGDPIALDTTLRVFGLHPDMIDRISEILEHGTFGQTFHTATNHVLIERERVVIRPAAPTAGKTYAASSIYDLEEQVLAISDCEKDDMDLSEGPFVAWFDKRAVQGKVALRPWRHGDRMEPWGMKGSKLVSDMLNEAGASAIEKERTYVLDVGGEIAWLVGHRIDDRFGVKERTEQILRVCYKTNPY